VEAAPGDWITLDCQLEAPLLAIELVTDRPIAPPSSSSSSETKRTASAPTGPSTKTTLIRFAIEGLQMSFTQRPYDRYGY
jgi:hypothetical protein